LGKVRVIVIDPSSLTFPHPFGICGVRPAHYIDASAAYGVKAALSKAAW